MLPEDCIVCEYLIAAKNDELPARTISVESRSKEPDARNSKEKHC
jgi:hypothetical protein